MRLCNIGSTGATGILGQMGSSPRAAAATSLAQVSVGASAGSDPRLRESFGQMSAHPEDLTQVHAVGLVAERR